MGEAVTAQAGSKQGYSSAGVRQHEDTAAGRRGTHSHTDNDQCVVEPSAYEIAAWHELKRPRPRPFSAVSKEASKRAASAFGTAGQLVQEQLSRHPRARSAVERSQRVAERGTRAATEQGRRLVSNLPDGVADWASAGTGSVQKVLSRLSRIGLTQKRIVSRHRARGHDVQRLSDLRDLDLEQIDLVRGRAAEWYFPIFAALSGAGASFVISGGELVVTVSAGAAAAPGIGTIAGVYVGDAAVVLGLSSRAVGQTALSYGYDPDLPSEKLFIMAVANAGTAISAGAKAAAFADVSKLTQALVRGATWEVLNQSVVAQVASQFSKRFAARLTKQGLGKIVPVAGVIIGGAFNWTTLDSIVDAANVAYRRRFLLEKYPQLAADADESTSADTADAGVVDEEISVLDDLDEAGGPDLR